MLLTIFAARAAIMFSGMFRYLPLLNLQSRTRWAHKVLTVGALSGASDQLKECIVPCIGILQRGRCLAAQNSPCRRSRKQPRTSHQTWRLARVVLGLYTRVSLLMAPSSLSNGPRRFVLIFFVTCLCKLVLAARLYEFPFFPECVWQAYGPWVLERDWDIATHWAPEFSQVSWVPGVWWRAVDHCGVCSQWESSRAPWL